MADVAERCRAAGMNDHLAKPVSPDALQRAVARWAMAPAPTRTGSDGASSGGPAASALGGLAAHLAGAALLPVIDEFEAGARARMAEIERHALAGDLSRIRAVAHDLSGTAANLGLAELSQAARLIEIACVEADTEAVRRLLPGGRMVFDRALLLLAAQRRRAQELGGAQNGGAVGAGGSSR
jgi:HPt (histidine-containing phosphotransfer) domain-containing protein